MRNLVVHTFGNKELRNRLKTELHLEPFVVGNLIDEEFSLMTPLGLQCKRCQQDGLLLDESLIFQLLDAKMSRYTKGEKCFLFTDIPENQEQLNKLREVHEKNNSIFYTVLIRESQEEFYNRAVVQLESEINQLEEELKSDKPKQVLRRAAARAEKKNQAALSLLQGTTHFLCVEDSLPEEEKFSLISEFFDAQSE